MSALEQKPNDSSATEGPMPAQLQAQHAQMAAQQGAQPGGQPGGPQAGKQTRTQAINPMQMAAQQATQATGGTPLPEDVKAKMEQRLHADFSKVRVHTNSEANQGGEAMNAPAYTVGHNIFFRAGFGVQNEQILAHELVHVVQQGGATPTAGAAKVGERHDAAEHEADKVGEAVARGEDAPAISTGHDASTVRRFGAGFEKDGHGSIEKDAAGGSGDSQGLKEMYSGNFMRDMNQLNVPKVIDGLQGLPKDVANPRGDKIGGGGAIEITSAVIKAMAILELGKEVANPLITKGNIGAYRPEEHIDNPMGTGAADTVVTNTDASKKHADGKTPVKVGEPRTAEGTVPEKADGKKPATTGVDADRDRDLKGSAFDGSQVENPDLYKVSPSGLSNHIYNSNESVKKRWIKAAGLGSSPLGRSEYGAGSHAVEDYFSHSNFVEVALNSYITQALSFRNKNQTSKSFAQKVVSSNVEKHGKETVGDQHFYVDTLYDASVSAPKTKGKPNKPGATRQAVTTGSFGGTDTMVSISHVLLPHLPKLQSALLKTVDTAFGIAKEDGGGGWAAIKAKLDTSKEGSAGATLLEGFDHAGMVAPVPDIKLKWKTFPITPGIFGDPVTVSLPYGLDHLSQSVPISAAFATYAGIYKQAKDMQALVHKYAEYAKKIFIPLDWLIELIDQEIQKIEQMARKAIKEQVTAGLVAVVDSISGRNEKDKAKAKQEGHAVDPKDPDAEFKKDLGDSLDYLHDSVETLEHETSIDSRLDHGDLSEMPQKKVEALVGPVKPMKSVKNGKVVRTYYVRDTEAPNAVPLPPSHSEIAKDHGPHAEVDHHHDRDNPEHGGNEAGSAFFTLARPLAVEAVKHADAAMQKVWAAKGGGNTSLFGDGKNYEFKSSVGGDSKAIHDGVLAESDANAAEEAKRAKAEGRHYAQSENAAAKQEGVPQLLNLVDFFIAHPDASNWWKAIFDAEIAANPQPIFESILRRNETRGNRAKKKPGE